MPCLDSPPLFRTWFRPAVGVVCALALLGGSGCGKQDAPTAAAVVSRPTPTGSPPTIASLTYVSEPIGLPMGNKPVITHLALADLDEDGLLDVIACDGASQRVGWIRQSPRGVFTETVVGDPVPGPAHVSVCDLNGDGRPDLLVASMGSILPSNNKIGRVVVLENLGNGTFRNRVLLENVARVTDVRGADFNGDGRTDLVVGQFGYIEGEIRWMENLGDWTFRSHVLLSQPGTITVPPADYDQDGKVDFAALVSQDSEAVHWFRNLGGEFRDQVLWRARDESWGSSGMDVADLNRDGRPDLIVSNGDGFDVNMTKPARWHGLQWLENRGGGDFHYHRLGDMPGCYSPVSADLNQDGRPDVVTVSGFNDVMDADAVWLMAWMNEGQGRFTPVPLARDPTRLITVAAGDLDGNGVPVLVTGGMHLYPPFAHMSRVTLWRRKPADAPR
ncbi:MAG: VCBS repeat-containing protein [Opitutaceae bacterium]